MVAAALCAALCACSKPQDVLPDHIATPEASATVAPTAAVVQATTPAPTDTTVPTILPQTADAGRSYVDDTLFIGDSNTVRYTMYADDTGTAFSTLKNNIGVVSMGAGSITTLKCEKFKGDSTLYTIPDAVAKLQPKRIIIGFGSNNLGGSSTDATKFIAQYREGLVAIIKAWPYADIIVSAIPPLDQQRDNTNLTMTQVDAYNAALVTPPAGLKRTIPFRTGCIFPKRLSLPILLMCAPTLMSRRTAAPKAQPPSRSRTAYRWG